MKVRLLADANFNGYIVDGLRKRIPAIDFLGAHGVIPPRLPDPQVLLLAANLGRVLCRMIGERCRIIFTDFFKHSRRPV